MADNPNATLIETARRYLETLSDGERMLSQAEVQRFVRWCGADRPCDQLRGHEVANYAETLTGGVTDAAQRVETVRKFLAFAKKSGYTSTNLATHLRLRKGAATVAAGRGASVREVQLSPEQKVALEAELDSLKAQRPKILQDIQHARADKDFRENAPLDAARERQAYLESRIRDLEATLAQAVVVEPQQASPGEAVEIGSTVHLRNLQTGADTIYTLVRPGEINAAQGRISFESPVGRALLQRRAGDEVEVAAPSGTLRFRVERVEG